MNPSVADLVLRRVPPDRRHLARALAPDAPDDTGCNWWELVASRPRPIGRRPVSR